MVLEYANNGALSDLLKNNQKLSTPQSCYFMHNLADAVAYLHQRSVIHRDIKPENILMFKKGSKIMPKLADFSLAIHAPSSR